MPRIRKIDCTPKSRKNFFLVDANFFANKYIPSNFAPNPAQEKRIKSCLEWWKEIDKQLRTRKARVYVPDLCIAETFKTLAKKYYVDKWFKTPQDLNNARNRLNKDIVTTARTLRSYDRVIKYHDISTSRDIIIAVDRFYETFMKQGLSVSLPDLVILATAKYLIDFYDIPKDCLHIVTLDRNLRRGLRKIPELPNAYDPTLPSDRYDKVFR